MAHYNLIFQGKIVDGASLDEVKNNVARLFKADAAKTAALFSGKSIVIKKNLDTESTKKYLAIMKKAGAIIRAVKVEDKVVEETPEITSPPPSPVKTNTNDTATQTAAGLSAGLASLVNYNKPTEQIPASSVESEPEAETDTTNELKLVPAGMDISTLDKKKEVSEIPDISHLTLSEAETGSLEEFAPAIEAVELPDIDNLTMSEANTGSMEEFAIHAEAIELPDISDLDMAEQNNTPLSSDASKPAPADIPDTSEFSMSEANEGTLEGIEIKPEPAEIPDISHIKIEQVDEKTSVDTAVKKNITGKANFQIN
jgi:hypothetical protein